MFNLFKSQNKNDLPEATLKITTPLVKDHQHADHLLSVLEEALVNNDHPASNNAFIELNEDLLAHFSTEEEMLFPLMEKAQGYAIGPVSVMVSEHRQMRDLLNDLKTSVNDNDTDISIAICETLQVFIQQHNMKEENILYPMANQTLSAQQDELQTHFQTHLLVYKDC